jgi:hypothetical protein
MRCGVLRSFVIAGCVVVVSHLTPTNSPHAAESASGAYLLGLRGPGAGVTPPEGLFFSNQTYVYSGRINGSIRLENGTLLSQARVSPLVNVPTFLWMTPIEVGGVRLGTSLTIPFGNVSVKGNLGPLSRKDQAFTVADPSIGLFLGGRSGQFHWQAGVSVFLPVGDYRRGALANVSKNRGALDVYGALSWIDPALGLDITNVVGVTFNTQNEATKYKTGNEFHWEWAVTKKFENGLSVGGVGYVYQQLTGDTGPGALLGSFKGRTAAVGASLGYDFKIGQAPISTRLRFYHEVESTRRLRGNAVFLSFSLPLWVPGER